MKRERILFIDFARGLAILFMVMVHVLTEMGTSGVIKSWFGNTVNFLGGPPAAPVFMFLMGVSLIMSRNTDIKKGVYRGVKLLVLAYLLNFLRGTLPILIECFFEYEWAPIPLAESFWVVDILQFAGLALIILTVVRKYLQKPLYWVILALAVAVGAPLLWGKMSGQPLLDWLLTLFWGVGGEQVGFPVFPWLFYPLLGMAFGYWLVGAEERNRFMNRSALFGLGLLVIGSAVIATDFSFHVGDYWRSGPGALIWIAGFVLVELYCCHRLVVLIPDNFCFRTLYYWSTNVTVFYFIHWIIIGWLSFVVTLDSILLLLAVMAGVTIITDCCTRLWKKELLR